LIIVIKKKKTLSRQWSRKPIEQRSEGAGGVLGFIRRKDKIYFTQYKQQYNNKAIRVLNEGGRGMTE